MQLQGINTSDYENPLFQELLESIVDIFFILDKNYQVLYWNKKVIEVTGIKAEKILYKSIYDFFPGIKGDALDKVFQKAMKTRKKDS